MGTFEQDRKWHYFRNMSLDQYHTWLKDNAINECHLNKCAFINAFEVARHRGYDLGLDEAKKEAAQLVTDLYQALKAIEGVPTFRDLVSLRKRIKRIGLK